MRKLVTTTFMSLDGVMQAPGGSQEDVEGSFAYGGWSFPFWDDAIGDFMNDLMGKPFDLVLGRKTYDLFASFWPNQPEEGKALNEARKYVASRSNPNLSWDHSQLLEGDALEAVEALKQTDGPELQVHGSSDLLQTLLAGDVIDEIRVITYPVTLGGGKRLFGEGTPAQTLETVSTKVAGNGVIMAVYKPAGEVKVGSFGE